MAYQTNNTSPYVGEQSPPAPIKSTPIETKSIADLLNLDAHTTSLGEPNPLLSVSLGQFGLQDANDVLEFFHTPAGETVIDEFVKEMAIERAREEELLFEQSEEDRLKRRIKIALFLYYQEKEANALEIQNLIREQTERALGASHHQETKTNTTTTPNQQELDQMIMNYDTSIRHAEKKQSLLVEEEQALIEEFSLLEKQSEQRTKKFDLYEGNVKDDDFTQFIKNDGVVDLDKIKNTQNNYAEQMNQLYEQINERMARDEDVSDLVQEQTAINLKNGVLEDIVAVAEGRKVFLNAAGEQVNLAKDAMFIVNKKDTLIYENGQYYLLKPQQNWDEVKDNPELRQQALEKGKDNFERHKPEILTVKLVVKHNKGVEETAHQEKMDLNSQDRSNNQAEQRLVQNQVRLLQSARADAQRALSEARKASKSPQGMQQGGGGTAPRPRVTPSITRTSHGSAPTPSPRISMTFERKLQELKQAKHLTNKSLNDLINLMPGSTNQASAQQLIKNLLANGTNLARATPQLRDRLLKQMESYGVTSPVMNRGDKINESPTPFDTRPKPYKLW